MYIRWFFVVLIGASFAFEPMIGSDVSKDELRQANQKGERVVCYYINWAIGRDSEGKFGPKDLDPSLCTHINYAFAELDKNDYTLKSGNPGTDISRNGYRQITGLKSRNSKLKVLLSLGGWGDSKGNKYSTLVGDSSKRKNFIQKAIPFLKQYNFDGLDLDWEYPRCWQGKCNAGPASDKKNFAIFVEELRKAFDQQNPKLLLTAAVVGGGDIVNQGYDVPSISKNMDFINLMTYDFHSSYDGKTGHHAQRTARSGDGSSDLNMEDSAKFWASKGAPRNKLVIGVPAYGRSFKLSSSSNNGLGAKTGGAGQAGPITKEEGFLGYYEICKNLKQGWKKQRDAKAGPWVSSGNQWVGYDDPEDIATKAKYSRDNGFGGVMVWDVTMDDFRGTCCKTKFPILKSMNYGTFGRGGAPSSYGCP